MPEAASKKILLVPLDWGLGHTTRCIPIIKELLAQNVLLEIGGTEITNALLQKEFPTLTYHLYPSYAVSYPEKAGDFLAHIFKQMPKIVRAVLQEKKITHQLVTQKKFDIIVSDNRFGVRDKRCYNLFITHQLNVLVPQSKILAWFTNWKNHAYINKFQQVLVPDNAAQLLSGALTNTRGIKISVDYLGNLSRWQLNKNVEESEGSILAILSGPEPQRTMLENLLVAQAENVKSQMTIVRAKPKDEHLPTADGVTFYNHLNAQELQQLAQQSEIIISRAGYSTIMDLVAVQKHAILIPTPGQTEQEYLAEYLAAHNLFHFYNQDNFDFVSAIKKFQTEDWKAFPVFENKLKEILKKILNRS